MSMIRNITICCLLLLLNVAAQAQETTDSVTTDSVSTQTTKQKLMARLSQVQQLLDAKARAKVDSNYIEVPKKPWRVVLRYKESVYDVDYSNSVGSPAAGDGMDWEMRFEPPLSASLGVWAGYRGLGVSVAKSLGKKKGTSLSFSCTGARYGANLRLRGFDIDEATLTGTIYEGGQVLHGTSDAHFRAPVSIASLYLNGYYVFNGRRYSQAAAYNQSVIQRRSAGSLLLGATWYMAALDYSDDKNTGMILLSRNIGRINVQQGNIGVGYGYNWVPFRGFVVNVMAMPALCFYNRMKVYKYDSNYEIAESEGQVDDYGQWNPDTHTWANGKTHKPVPTDDSDTSWYDTVDSWEVGSDTSFSMLRFNVDLRIGIAYNWSNYFVGLQSQFNNFNFKKDQCKVNLYDAWARLSFGVRL